MSSIIMKSENMIQFKFKDHVNNQKFEKNAEPYFFKKTGYPCIFIKPLVQNFCLVILAMVPVLLITVGWEFESVVWVLVRLIKKHEHGHGHGKQCMDTGQWHCRDTDTSTGSFLK